MLINGYPVFSSFKDVIPVHCSGYDIQIITVIYVNIIYPENEEMTERSRKKLKKWIFPAGIFLLLFFTETIIGAGAVFSYFYFEGKKEIEQIEKYTVNYSTTMAEAFSRVAELSYRTKKYSSLKTLFHEKIEENTIDEAFFVLSDGKLIVHSNTTIEKGLMGNITNDEMSYNIDLILQPVTKKSTVLFLTDYNIIDKQIPFKREVRNYLEKYYYKDINSSGWLFTKGVFSNGKPVGSVNFIISKDRIFNSINESIANARLMAIAATATAFFVSLIVSLIVMFRYRSIQKRAGEFSKTDTGEDIFAVPLPAVTNISGPVHTDEIIHAAESYSLDDDFDLFIDDYPDDFIIEEEPDLYYTKAEFDDTDETLPVINSRASAGDDEYITIELLGEIDEEETLKPELDLMDGGRVYIAPVISSDALKKTDTREIRDAIPVGRKR